MALPDALYALERAILAERDAQVASERDTWQLMRDADAANLQDWVDAYRAIEQQVAALVEAARNVEEYGDSSRDELTAALEPFRTQRKKGEVMEQSVSVGDARVELMNVRTYRKPRFMPLQPLYECQNCGEIVESVCLGPWMIGWCADCFDEEWPEEIEAADA